MVLSYSPGYKVVDLEKWIDICKREAEDDKARILTQKEPIVELRYRYDPVTKVEKTLIVRRIISTKRGDHGTFRTVAICHDKDALKIGQSIMNGSYQNTSEGENLGENGM